MLKFFAVLIGTIALAWGTNGDDIGAGPKRKFFLCQWSAMYTKLSRVKLLFCPDPKLKDLLKPYYTGITSSKWRHSLSLEKNSVKDGFNDP